MQKEDIIIGHIYSDGKGRERKVIDIGPQYRQYENQIAADNLLYEAVKGSGRGARPIGDCFPMTVAAFSTWAKLDVTPDAQ